MGLFSKPEVVIARESTNAKVYLEKLEELLPEAEDEVKEKIWIYVKTLDTKS